MRTFEEIKRTVETGLGMHPCDLKLTNLQLVNVCSGEIYPTDIYIKGQRVVSIDPDAKLEAKETVDCGGQYALPGLIDCHMHFETTMLCPEALASVVVPTGSTTLCADLMEIANVAGEQGLRVMLQSIHTLPYRMLIEVSSRVPTAPGLETTGAVLDAEAVARIMGWEESVSLGELDPSKILFVKDEYLRKIADTLQRRKIVNGHAIGRMGQELNVYASAGISDDHECVTVEEGLARLRVGMSILVREGSSERNLDALITGLLERHMELDNVLFCTDDKHVDDVRREGHINYNVNRSIELGMPPMQAIKAATINAAKHFRIEDEVGSITPGRLADILLVKDIRHIEPTAVFFAGKLVARNGTLSADCPVSAYPDWIKDTVRLKEPVTPERFVKRAKGECVGVRVINTINRQIINRASVERLPVVDGVIQNDLERDIIKLAVVERYGKTGGVGIGFLHGFHLKRGAMAFSTSHDHHNIVVAGVNDRDMAAAVNEVVRLHGGLSCACDGAITASMPLPLGGLMSDKDADTVARELAVMNEAALALGCDVAAPFMALSFISLPTVPELGLTDMGLIDVLGHTLIDVEAD